MQNRRNYTPEVPEFKEKLVSVNRVAKVVKGGKIFRFSALIVVGDEKGRVGVGMGKAAEIPEAVRKGVEDAKRHLINVPIVGTTIPHAVEGKFSKGHVRMLPAEPGTGVIAGGPVRCVLEMVGIKDIRTKSYGSNNPANCVKATLDGLAQLRTAEQVAHLRGKSVAEIIMANLKVTLVKSTIGALKDQQATVKALGLHKLNHTVIKPDNACIRGMIFKVKHLVKVEEVDA